MLRRLLVVSIAAAGVSACSTNPPPPSATDAGSVAIAPRPASLSVGERAAAVALRQVGVPYRYGGKSPNGFDCSGLVYYSYVQAGKRVPRTTAALWSTTVPITRENLHAGDLLFFQIDGKMSHVGMYLGNGRFVHAPSSGKSVAVQSLNSPFYRHALLRAGRPR